MNELDPTGARANAPGLTPDALKAEKRAKRAAEAAARKERRKAFFAKLRANLPMTLFAAIVVAVIVSATLFDWFMSSRGWQDILPDLGVFAWLGAAASVGFWYVGAYQAGAEIYQNKALEKGKRDYTEAVVWSVIALVAYTVCVGGVIIATLTNTSRAKAEAEQSRKQYAEIVSRRDELAENLDIYSIEYWEQRLEADKRTQRARLNIAKATLGMTDLDVDGGCAQKLNFNQQRACAYWNGGTDPATGVDVAGILADIEQNEAGLKKAQEETAELADLVERARTFEVKTGDATARALGEYFESETAGNQWMIGIITFFSAAFLLCGGLFGHGAVRLLRKVA
ncbi:MAG: hypothetical protein NW204_13515 [Xanthomonadaceae bacterium]|nr:hypothetical protein [Xanthomonadaceae bacterium]